MHPAAGLTCMCLSGCVSHVLGCRRREGGGGRESRSDGCLNHHRYCCARAVTSIRMVSVTLRNSGEDATPEHGLQKRRGWNGRNPGLAHAVQTLSAWIAQYQQLAGSVMPARVPAQCTHHWLIPRVQRLFPPRCSPPDAAAAIPAATEDVVVRAAHTCDRPAVPNQSLQEAGALAGPGI